MVNEVAENKEIAQQYKELLRISYQRLTSSDKKLIRLAFDIAVDAHKNQRRKSGEPYVFHPISVAKIVADEIGLDSTSIASALLHDVIEDSNYTIEDIKKTFGNTISKGSIPKVLVIVEVGYQTELSKSFLRIVSVMVAEAEL